MEVLESNKDYRNKCDYIGFSILSLDDKIKLIDEQINELKEYKGKLNEAKELVLETGAKVFKEYGIQKLEGAGISSITLTQGSSSSKTSLVVSNEQALIEQGFYKKVLDEKILLDAFINGNYEKLILSHARVETKEIIKPSKIKVNRRETVTTRLAS